MAIFNSKLLLYQRYMAHDYKGWWPAGLILTGLWPGSGRLRHQDARPVFARDISTSSIEKMNIFSEVLGFWIQMIVVSFFRVTGELDEVLVAFGSLKTACYEEKSIYELWIFLCLMAPLRIWTTHAQLAFEVALGTTDRKRRRPQRVATRNGVPTW